MSLKSRLSGLVKAALHFGLSMLDLAQKKKCFMPLYIRLEVLLFVFAQF